MFSASRVTCRSQLWSFVVSPTYTRLTLARPWYCSTGNRNFRMAAVCDRGMPYFKDDCRIKWRSASVTSADFREVTPAESLLFCETRFVLHQLRLLRIVTLGTRRKRVLFLPGVFRQAAYCTDRRHHYAPPAIAEPRRNFLVRDDKPLSGATF